MGPLLDNLESSEVSLTILRTGAEMISLRHREADGTWAGVLYRDGDSSAPTSGWGNHCTLMGYFLHRLWNEESFYRGSRIRGGNHGFLRHFEFDAPDRSVDSLTYHVPPDHIPADAYPLRVGLALTYQIVGRDVRITFRFENHEATRDAHVSFGMHPGFAVSSPLTCSLDFPAGTYRRFFAPGNFLDGRTEEINHPGGEPSFLNRGDLPGSFLLGLEGVPERMFQISDGRRSVGLDFSEVPYLTIWSDMNPFLCLEPCWGLPDSSPPVAFEHKVGIQVIPPGAILNRGFAIRIQS